MSSYTVLCSAHIRFDNLRWIRFPTVTFDFIIWSALLDRKIHQISQVFSSKFKFKLGTILYPEMSPDGPSQNRLKMHS